MKKIIFISMLSILIPLVIVTTLTNEFEPHNLSYKKNYVVRVKRDSENIIEEVPFEEYVLGVLAGEMPLYFEKEALKAQAVAARSYCMKKMEQNNNKEYDIVDTILNQVYISKEELKKMWQEKFDERYKILEEVIKETMGEYLSYDGEVIEAFFFSTSAGVTENSGEVFMTQLPYLVSVESTWDEEVSPVYTSKENMSLYDFYSKLNLSYDDNLNIEITKKTSTGRVKEIKINGKTFTANQITSRLDLRSTYFSIEREGSNITIDVKGYGHGVGMSQYGAEGMARHGYNYEEILKYYYQGASIEKI